MRFEQQPFLRSLTTDEEDSPYSKNAAQSRPAQNALAATGYITKQNAIPILLYCITIISLIRVNNAECTIASFIIIIIHINISNLLHNNNTIIYLLYLLQQE